MPAEQRGFADRTQAGRLLGELLRRFARRDDVVALALQRGGVPVAFEVARALDAPLDLFLVRSLGLPGHEELPLGAVASGGTRVLNQQLIESRNVRREAIDAVTARELRELQRRERAYRGDRPPQALGGRTAILVDDGLATDATMVAAIHAARRDAPARVVVAVPVAAPEVCKSLRAEADEAVCLFAPAPFQAVGVWYQDFSQVSAGDVRALLRRASRQECSSEPLRPVRAAGPARTHSAS